MIWSQDSTFAAGSSQMPYFNPVSFSNIMSRPPGGGYSLPAPISGVNSSAGGQERGGQGSDTNPDGPDGPGGPTPNSTASAPTQVGIVEGCNAFAFCSANDTCYDMSQRFDITLAQFTTWNPVLGYPDGHNCTTQFWAGYDYCVGVSGGSGGSSSTNIESSSSTSSLPYPTQSGIAPACSKYIEAKNGDYCFIFAQNNNITTDELYSWNTILGPNGANCSTEFQAGYDYCVSTVLDPCEFPHTHLGMNQVGVFTTSATATSTPTPTSSPTTSSAIPTQSGLASNCNKIVVAQKGDTCSSFAQANGTNPFLMKLVVVKGAGEGGGMKEKRSSNANL